MRHLFGLAFSLVSTHGRGHFFPTRREYVQRDLGFPSFHPVERIDTFQYTLLRVDLVTSQLSSTTSRRRSRSAGQFLLTSAHSWEYSILRQTGKRVGWGMISLLIAASRSFLIDISRCLGTRCLLSPHIIGPCSRSPQVLRPFVWALHTHTLLQLLNRGLTSCAFVGCILKVQLLLPDATATLQFDFSSQRASCQRLPVRRDASPSVAQSHKLRGNT